MPVQNQDMPSPVSEPPLTPVSRKVSRFSDDDGRQPSVMSDDASSVAEASDPCNPQRSRSFKRAEDPPRNPEGKMICRFAECSRFLFDRKCEWRSAFPRLFYLFRASQPLTSHSSKHMDKHDRPYKCKARGCEKMQGFTYSGGLLRHEREVHKMHGGTKQPLFCPHKDCKRSGGAGFTRKENLAEHVRRVHRRTSGSSTMSRPVNKEDEEGSEGVVGNESPRAPSPDPRLLEEAKKAGKRKRPAKETVEESEEAHLTDEADLRGEIKRLRREIETRDERLQKLEAAVEELTRQQR